MTNNQIKRKQLGIPVANKATKVRPKVQCCCKGCNGKWVDSRTRDKHYAEKENFRLAIEKKKDHYIQVSGSSSVTRKHQPVIAKSFPVIDDIQVIDEFSSFDIDEQYNTNLESTYTGRKRQRYDQFLNPNNNDTHLNEEVDQQPSSDDEDFSLVDDLSDDDVSNEQFAAPDLDDFNDSDEILNMHINYTDSWILIWIFKYQMRFRLSDSAINALIQFFKLVLLDVDKNRFEGFPSSAYMARKLMGFVKKSRTYAVCPSCDKLFNSAEIIPVDNQNSGKKCDHIEFPDHLMKNQRKPCGTDLLKKVPIAKGHIWRPKMVYPLPCLKTQLVTLYQRPGFEDLLRKWTNRGAIGLMSDIYDGDVWKTFPSQCNIPNPSQFFTPENADSHLGIIINLDWFQPFDSSVYSCGLIYGAICNLPRDVRFKKENMLTLGILPGPKEVKSHHINHYLSPIVDDLLELWNGFDMPVSLEHKKRIRLAVICCSSDIPAARKLCGHISALVGCHRCYKRAASDADDQRANYGGFDDIDDWFRERDLNEHRRNAEGWLRCKSNEERKEHVSFTQVRWSEMLRLPYFNPIRHLVVDPMHCLFLGIARWIVKRLWVDGGKINKSNLELMAKRAKKICVPADIGRVPYKIATGEGFSGFTADQWKSFIMIYATPIMWDLLDDVDREILANFVRACYLLVSRIVDESKLSEAHSRLLAVAKLIEDHYGPEVITPNIHLSLHIAQCCRDYGPLCSFWCFSFERMNGILGELLMQLLFIIIIIEL